MMKSPFDFMKLFVTDILLNIHSQNQLNAEVTNI